MPLTINIRDLRKARGLTLGELADMIGVSTPHMSQVERGLKNLNNHLLERIAAALEATPADLIRGNVASDLTRLAEKIQRLDREDRDRVEAFVDALLASRRMQPG
ncbi:helix-turn-helix domain-containing protein [Defluviimonas sp. WL0024]|uniref:Helix-turn-helix domain-containing protein n=1 Tax=Albidovulum salinarum TaxID=2984153 RepID=A0ABT2X9J9_9RHOB|nr:helix-turn-helix transcriptional regulator [Defluviimonas sp. WL0024]MCU9850620.1 helix-turn-helix domain-containing protein [Defluviimonas sp. WL0024]